MSGVSESLQQSGHVPKRVKASGGRPSKGPRHQFVVRVSPDLADEVFAEAERLDLSFNETIANALAAHYGYPLIAVPQNDQQMKLTA